MSAVQNGLAAMTREWRAEWDETKQYWNDAKSREFEEHFMTELLPAVSQTINTVESLERVLAKLRQDCQ